MTQSKETRALQHLLLQGFEVLPCYAAVATLLFDRSVILNRSWAVVCDNNSVAWVNRLPDNEELKVILSECASKTVTTGQQHVVCCIQGVCLVTELDPSGTVREAKMRILGAIEQNRMPPVEKLEAFGDEALEAEIERRKRKKIKDETIPAQRAKP